ncbi:hypothetical protein QTO34_010195 [Cnephaeus nilssonii]|uniref:Selenoprotein W n=1 Tax=Cnephaeus nilssonii TaxID=3371016 RepID=A0AA40HF10_CNENI|nr:hypothetical protein QTO34_010195 [Eptesicus nilssonii]
MHHLNLLRVGNFSSVLQEGKLRLRVGRQVPGYLQLKKKLEDEFPGRLDICGEGTPQVTGFFEVMVAGKLVHSKKGGDGYVDTESKFLKLVAAIKAALAQAVCPEGGVRSGPAAISTLFSAIPRPFSTSEPDFRFPSQ